MSKLRAFSVAILLIIGIAGLVTAAAVVSAPTIVIEKAVHFLTPSGEDVVVGPGTYQVEAVKEGIQLTPKGGEAAKAVVVQALTRPHPESLTTPKALSEPGVEDEHRVALLLPDGQGLEAVGSYSGVRTRGGLYNVTYGTQLPSTNTGSNITAIGHMALSANTGGSNSTAMGAQALLKNNAGYNNTAVGFAALNANTSGSSNTAVGTQALGNATGSNNTATGRLALYSNTTGSNNTAMGAEALRGRRPDPYLADSGSNNTAVGHKALTTNFAGAFNSATGGNALYANITGHHNTAIGYHAGTYSTGHHNIYLTHQGVAGESNTIRIGMPSLQLHTFITGVSGVFLSGASVVVDTNGQLGVVPPSSRRYKEDIQDLGAASEGLLHLRPVTFRYKADAVPGAHPRNYGLIAEEVAEVYPDLVAYGPDGQVETVQYHQLIPMLLNELQQQHRQNEEQDRQIQALTARVAELEAK